MELFDIVIGDGPIVATAIHDGHDVRAEVAAAMVLPEAHRLREEDPFTARFAAVAPTRIIARRSRFEVDLNRPRDKAVYTCAEDAWGLEIWSAPPAAGLVDGSLAIYDAFYAELGQILADKIARHGQVIVLDCHSYNHCREGAGCAADPAANPEVNVGTGTLPARWRPLAERFCADLTARGFDARENVKFQGGEMSKWIHRTFPDAAACLALEFKKTFMDEWTGVPDDAHIARITEALADTVRGLGAP